MISCPKYFKFKPDGQKAMAAYYHLSKVRGVRITLVVDPTILLVARKISSGKKKVRLGKK